jgi:hypothetical protein
MKRIFPILIITILFYSCSQEPKFDGVWLGIAREMDKEVFIPMPRLMVAKSDGYFNSYQIDKPDSNSTNWEIKNSTLYIDTTKFISSRFEISKSQFIFKGPFKAYYQRLDNKFKALDISNLNKFLVSSSWESEYDIVSFNKSDELILFDKSDTTFNKLCWNINKAEGFPFIIKKGNHLDCESFYRFPELIIDFNENQFTIKRWEKDTWKEVVYSKVDPQKKDFDSSNFQTCNPYLYRGNPQHRYYYKGTFYKGGFYKINKLFNAYYQKPEISTESGLIKVEFIVNCQGKPGRFSMMEFDKNYKLKKFSSKISSQIFEFTKTLKDWNAGKNKEGESIDTFRFLTFKIKNSEVIEIFP